MILVTICDDEYLKFAIPCVKSFLVHHPGGQAVVYRINPKVKMKDFKGCFFSEFATNYFKIKMSKAGLAANARVFILKSLMEDLPENMQVLYLDADSIVRGYVPDCRGDVSSFARPNEIREDMRYLISTIRFKANFAARLFCTKWELATRALIESGEDSIMTCQKTFKRALESSSKDVIFEPAEKKLSDWDFEESSPIWCAKGPRKENPTFEAEMKKYE